MGELAPGGHCEYAECARSIGSDACDDGAPDPRSRKRCRRKGRIAGVVIHTGGRGRETCGRGECAECGIAGGGQCGVLRLRGGGSDVGEHQPRDHDMPGVLGRPPPPGDACVEGAVADAGQVGAGAAAVHAGDGKRAR